MNKVEENSENAVDTAKEIVKQKKTAITKKNVKKDKEVMVYIGPYLRHVAMSGTIYNNGIPDALEKMKEKHPFMGRLIVPIEDLADAKKEIETKGTALSVCYSKALLLNKED